MRSPWLRVEWSVFVLLVGSYAFFWHSRDWNTASRLILTYAMADRGTVCLDGLDRQTGDIALFQGHYYCDKLPGFSLLGMAPYRLARTVARLSRPSPEVGGQGLLAGRLLGHAGHLGVVHGHDGGTARAARTRPRLFATTSALVGLAYGLATPAYVYATLAYGHQLSAFALTASFYLLSKRGDSCRAPARGPAAGFLAAYAAIIELQVGPASAILGLYLLVQCLRGRRRPDALAFFGIGAADPNLILLGLQLTRVRLVWEMGYFHHATATSRRSTVARTPWDSSLRTRAWWGPCSGALSRPALLCAHPAAGFPGMVGAAQARAWSDWLPCYSVDRGGGLAS